MRIAFLSAAALSSALVACSSAPTNEPADEDTAEVASAISVITGSPSVGAGGAFSCDFGLPATMLLQQVGPIIERDRMYMAARPGFVRKQIPFWVAPLNAGFDTGGRYLFQTKAQADAYAAWVLNDFVLDGTHFFDRDYFLSPVCRTWTVIGATDIGTFPDQQVFVRTERWAAPAGNQKPYLRGIFAALELAAIAQQYTGLRLLYSAPDNLVEITYFADRRIPANPAVPDALGLELLALRPALGSTLGAGYTKNFDRTQFVLTAWKPFVAGDQGPESPWPSSPPLPGPSCGDGLCSPSRGEDGASCGGDCRPRCGDAICQPGDGEDTAVCPSDCRI